MCPELRVVSVKSGEKGFQIYAQGLSTAKSCKAISGINIRECKLNAIRISWVKIKQRTLWEIDVINSYKTI